MEAKRLRVAAPPPAIPTPSSYSSKFSKTHIFSAQQRSSQVCSSLRLLNSRFPKHQIQSVHSSATSTGFEAKNRVDESKSYTLDGIRSSFIRQEDSIIFSLVERAQYYYNTDTYDPNAFLKDGDHWLSLWSEKLKSFMLRLEDIRALTSILSSQMTYLTRCCHLCSTSNKIWDMYFRNLLPKLVEEGSDVNCGSTAVCDTICMQALLKRIHYGKFVAEAKFRASPDAYEAAIRVQDRAQLMNLLTYLAMEEAVTRRVEMKTRTYAQEVMGDKFEPVNKKKNQA